MNKVFINKLIKVILVFMFSIIGICICVCILGIFLYMCGIIVYEEAHDLGKGFTYIETPSMIIYHTDSLNYTIPDEILFYANTDDYILIEQHPSEIPYVGETDAAPFESYPYGRDTLYYFLIDKNTKEVVGPMSSSEIDSVLQEKNLMQMTQMLEPCKGAVNYIKSAVNHQ